MLSVLIQIVETTSNVMKIKLSGDICHPGMIEMEVDSIKDLLAILERKEGKLIDEEDEFKIDDEQSDCLMFIWDGHIFDEQGNEI